MHVLRHIGPLGAALGAPVRAVCPRPGTGARFHIRFFDARSAWGVARRLRLSRRRRPRDVRESSAWVRARCGSARRRAARRRSPRAATLLGATTTRRRAPASPASGAATRSTRLGDPHRRRGVPGPLHRRPRASATAPAVEARAGSTTSAPLTTMRGVPRRHGRAHARLAGAGRAAAGGAGRARPKMLELAADAADGAHPYFVPVEHTRAGPRDPRRRQAAGARAGGRARDRSRPRPAGSPGSTRAASTSQLPNYVEQPAVARLRPTTTSPAAAPTRSSTPSSRGATRPRSPHRVAARTSTPAPTTSACSP